MAPSARGLGPQKARRGLRWQAWLATLLLWGCPAGHAAEAEVLSTNAAALAPADRPLAAVLPAARWHQMDNSIDRALAWLAAHQAADGSFPTLPAAQPAVTSLGVMAFLSRGHQPGKGAYGERLERAIDFVLSCQEADGLFSYRHPGAGHIDKQPSHTAVYNHAIAGLMLGEVYGQVSGPRARAVKAAIERALAWTRQLQMRPRSPEQAGGWRYLRYFDPQIDSDLSVTAWQLMFLRSAKNAEFDVPQSYVDEAVAYVQRLWDPASGGFNYEISGRGADGVTRGMVGAGIVSLSMAGQHQSPRALAAGRWLLAHPCRGFGDRVGYNDRFFYSLYYCSQAAAQLGGRYWEGFFPTVVDALLGAQEPDGSWPAEVGTGDDIYGNALTTSLAVLALTPPYQLLPVYQR